MKKPVVLNTDTVIAHTTDNKIFTWKMVDLKQAFLSKKLPYVVKFIYLPRNNTNYFVSLNPTKGFKFTKYEDYLKKNGGK